MICPHCGKPIAKAITPKQIEKIKSLGIDGYSCRDIAAMVGCSFSTVSRILSNKKKTRTPK